MYDIKLLEEEWEQYNKKRKKPLFFGLSLFALLLIAAGVFFAFGDQWIQKNENNSTQAAVKKQKTEVLLNDAIDTLAVKKENRIEISRENTENSTEIDDPMRESTFKIELSDKPEAVKAPVIKKETEEEKPRKKMHLNIIQTSSVSAYDDVKERFRSMPNTDDSLFLARAYYSRGNYNKAIYWAVETNKLDANIDESWMIFAKSKVKTGHKNEARRILNTYIKKSGSMTAKAYLKKIQ